MAKIKIEKEELERDEFMENADRALLWFKDNGRTIAMVLAIIIAAYAIFGLISSRRYGTLVQANDALATALADYENALNAHAWASDQRIAAMEDVARQADDIVARFPNTSIANQARFLKGSAYFNAGDSIESAREGGARNTANAISTFAEFVASANRPFDRAKGRLALGYAYENAFFLNNDRAALGDAMRTFNEAHSDASAPDFLRAEALLAEARLLAFDGNTEQAIARYRQVMEMRYEPMEPLGTDAGPGQELLRQLDMRRSTFSIVGTARLELQRLGVDVEAEYPLERRAEESAS